MDMYEAEYRNEKNGWASEAVEANSVKMKALREEQRALPDGVDRMSPEQICITVLGENSSYAKWKCLNRRQFNGLENITKVLPTISCIRLHVFYFNNYVPLSFCIALSTSRKFRWTFWAL
ncbi:hypothetical protein ACP275_11G077600 [Erythranthe tilingii]